MCTHQRWGDCEQQVGTNGCMQLALSQAPPCTATKSTPYTFRCCTGRSLGMRHSVPLVEMLVSNPSSGRVVTFHLQCPLVITSRCQGPIVTRLMLPASCSPFVCVYMCVCVCVVHACSVYIHALLNLTLLLNF